MKICSIKTCDNFVNKNNIEHTPDSNTFRGYVNGKFYKDEIIQKAKKALKDPEILKEFKQKSFLDTYKTWHEGNMAHSKGERIGLAILTLGLSEVSWTLIARLGDISDNIKNKKDLDEILSCMSDLINKK